MGMKRRSCAAPLLCTVAALVLQLCGAAHGRDYVGYDRKLVEVITLTEKMTELPKSTRSTLTVTDPVTHVTRSYLAGAYVGNNVGTTLFVGDYNRTFANSKPATTAFIYSTTGEFIAANGTDDKSKSIIHGLCSGVENGTTFLYAVGWTRADTYFGGTAVLAGPRSMAFVWKLTLDLKHVGIVTSQADDLTDTPSGLVVSVVFNGNLKWGNTYCNATSTDLSSAIIADVFGTDPIVSLFDGAMLGTIDAVRGTPTAAVVVGTFNKAFTCQNGSFTTSSGPSTLVAKFTSSPSGIVVKAATTVLQETPTYFSFHPDVISVSDDTAIVSTNYLYNLTVGATRCTTAGSANIGQMIGSYTFSNDTWNWVNCLASQTTNDFSTENPRGTFLPLAYIAQDRFAVGSSFTSLQTTIGGCGKIFSEGLDDAYTAMMKISDGSCTGILPHGTAGSYDASVSFSVDTASRKMSFCAISWSVIAQTVFKPRLISLDYLNCYNGLPDADAGVCVCSAGWIGSQCEIQCPMASGFACNNHGQCYADSVATAACRCSSDYTGAACETFCSCGANGVCQTNGECRCFPGWVGANCSVQCPGILNGLPCNGNGICALSGTTAACTCAAGFEGPACLPVDASSPHGFDGTASSSHPGTVVPPVVQSESSSHPGTIVPPVVQSTSSSHGTPLAPSAPKWISYAQSKALVGIAAVLGAIAIAAIAAVVVVACLAKKKKSASNTELTTW